MSPNLLLYPVSNKRKAFTRIAHGKVVHPTAKDRVDLLNHPLHRLADILSEDLLQLCQQRRPFFHFRRVVQSPLPVTAQSAAIFKAQESGTRVTVHYNAGKFGNDRPMTIDREFWYAAQLGFNLLSKRSDPRIGSQTFTVTNLALADPDPKLFELPEGFTVVDERRTAPPEN
jgi:hypothetical protein